MESNPDRRVERPSEVLRKLLDNSANQDTMNNAAITILDQLHASQLRADKFVAAMAKVWAMPCDGEPDEESRACKFAAREYLTPESQSQTAGSEWPSDVVKVWESVGDPIVRWAEYDSGKIYISHGNESIDHYPALAKRAELDGGVSDTGRKIRTIYSRYPSEAEVQREIDTICNRVEASQPAKAVEPASTNPQGLKVRTLAEAGIEGGLPKGAEYVEPASGDIGTKGVYWMVKCQQAEAERDALKLRAELAEAKLNAIAETMK